MINLAEILTELSIKLSIAAAEMARVAGLSANQAFVTIKLEVERLRDECENVKAELAHHRMKHGC